MSRNELLFWLIAGPAFALAVSAWQVRSTRDIPSKKVRFAVLARHIGINVTIACFIGLWLTVNEGGNAVDGYAISLNTQQWIFYIEGSILLLSTVAIIVGFAFHDKWQRRYSERVHRMRARELAHAEYARLNPGSVSAQDSCVPLMWEPPNTAWPVRTEV